jgi:hypothetical protein
LTISTEATSQNGGGGGKKKPMQNLLNIEQFCQRKFNKIKTKYFRKIRESFWYYWKAQMMSEIS